MTTAPETDTQQITTPDTRIPLSKVQKRDRERGKEMTRRMTDNAFLIKTIGELETDLQAARDLARKWKAKHDEVRNELLQDCEKYQDKIVALTLAKDLTSKDLPKLGWVAQKLMDEYGAKTWDEYLADSGNRAEWMKLGFGDASTAQPQPSTAPRLPDGWTADDPVFAGSTITIRYGFARLNPDNKTCDYFTIEVPRFRSANNDEFYRAVCAAVEGKAYHTLKDNDPMPEPIPLADALFLADTLDKTRHQTAPEAPGSTSEPRPTQDAAPGLGALAAAIGVAGFCGLIERRKEKTKQIIETVEVKQ